MSEKLPPPLVAFFNLDTEEQIPIVNNPTELEQLRRLAIAAGVEAHHEFIACLNAVDIEQGKFKTN